MCSGCAGLNPYTVLAGVGKNVILWDRETGKELRRLQGHDDVVTSIAVSPDGRKVVSGSKDKTLILWDLIKGTQQSPPRDNANTSIISVAFNPKAPIIAFGTEYIYGSKEGIVRLWNTNTGEVHELEDNGQAYSNYSVNSLTFNPDGTQLFSGLGGFQVVLWNLEVNANGSIASDGRLGVSGSQNSNVYLWDMASGKVLHTFVGHDGPVNAVAFSPDSKQVLSASADHSLRLWDTLPAVEHNVFTGESFGTAAISPDGKTVLSGDTDGKLRLWQLADGKVIQTIEGHPSWVWAIARYCQLSRQPCLVVSLVA